MTEIVIPLVLSYLAGSIPASVWVSRWIYKKDVRDGGSHNAGLTNMYRQFGWKSTIPVAVVDLGKGLFAAWLGVRSLQSLVSPQNFAMMAGLLAIMGHSYTCFAGFKGGKGVLTALGVYLFLVPFSALGAFLVWLSVLKPTGYVSLASISACVAMSVLISLEWAGGRCTGLIAIITYGLCLFIIVRHRSNISRLLAGTENRFGTHGPKT